MMSAFSCVNNQTSRLYRLTRATASIPEGIHKAPIIAQRNTSKYMPDHIAANNVASAARLKLFTQAIVTVTVDISNEVTFALATTNQTGYMNVPTGWLTNWPENAVITDSSFTVYEKYLLGLDPTTSNTFKLRVESFNMSDSNVIAVLKRTCTGGMSPDGMHGQLELQATDCLGSAFTNVVGSAATGLIAFDGTGRKIYTNAISGINRFIRAVIH